MIIPQQLNNEKFRFLPLEEKNKIPLKGFTNWQQINNFKYDDDRLLNHINNKNYGIILGYGNLIVIDSDSEEITKLADILPNTFTIKTGSKEIYKKHYYYILDEQIKPIRLSKNKLGDLGDIRSTGQYVVAPNSIHPSGNTYKILKDIPITKITKLDLMKVFSDYDKEQRFMASDNEPIQPQTTKTLNKFYRSCKVPDYLLNNKVKNNSSKNWKLFPMVVDILNRRNVNYNVYQQLCKTQNHDINAINGWIEYARNGTLTKKGTCDKMHHYLKFYSPELVKKICGNCPLYNKHQIIDKVEDDLKKAKSDNQKTLKELKREVMLNFSFNKQDSATEILTTHLLNKYDFHTIKNDKQTEIWYYDEGIVNPNGKCQIREDIRKILNEFYKLPISKQVIEKIETETFIEEEKFFSNDTSNKNELPLLNGILNTNTLQMSEYSSKKIFFHKLPITYDSTATCPNIDSFFKSILKNKEDVKVMYEFFGYLLLKENKLNMSFMAYGDGANGKTKCLELAKHFVGIDNTSQVSLQQMQTIEGNYDIGTLFGKLLNLAGDINSFTMTDTGVFKQLTGTDLISAPRKFLSPIKFYNYAKMMFSCNELPIITDMANGFWRRWLLFDFPYTFVDEYTYNKLDEDEKLKYKIKDDDILDKISTKTELSGLLNKALEGLIKITKNKRFSSSKGVDDIKNTWIRKSDSFVAFCMDMLEEGDIEKDFIIKADLRKTFNNYKVKFRLKPATDKHIKHVLTTTYGVDEVYKSDSETHIQHNCWAGMRFKPGMKQSLLIKK